MAKRLFLVEANTDYDSLFCYELLQCPDFTYERPECGSLFNNVDREQFFGNLNSLCITKAKFIAPPIRLAPPQETVGELVDRVLDANAGLERAEHA